MKDKDGERILVLNLDMRRRSRPTLPLLFQLDICICIYIQAGEREAGGIGIPVRVSSGESVHPPTTPFSVAVLRRLVLNTVVIDRLLLLLVVFFQVLLGKMEQVQVQVQVVGLWENDKLSAQLENNYFVLNWKFHDYINMIL